MDGLGFSKKGHHVTSPRAVRKKLTKTFEDCAFNPVLPPAGLGCQAMNPVRGNPEAH
jgi:hypothetical protein